VFVLWKELLVKQGLLTLSTSNVDLGKQFRSIATAIILINALKNTLIF